MNLKSLFSILAATILTSVVQAQTSATNTENKSSRLSGFYAGLDYVNLTDVRMESTIEYFDGQNNVVDKETSTGGTHMGLAGLSLGYKFNNANGSPISISTGLRVMQSFNKSEYGEDKVTFYIPDVNAGYLFTEKFEAYAGASIPVIRGTSLVNDYESRGGINLGFAVHPTKQFTLKAAYNAYAFHYEMKDPSFKGKLDMVISGLALTTQVNF